MSEAVFYLNRGTKCYPRLLTSIFSLRKHYHGNIVLIQEGELHHAIGNVLSKLGVEVRKVPESTESILTKKSSIWREMREDHAMYLDSDTIICGPIDDFFGWIKEKGFVATWFTGWLTTSIPVRARIEEWKIIAPNLITPALEYNKAINSGVQGWFKNAPILAEYERLTRQGVAAGCNRRVVDEIALQLLLPHHPHYLAHHAWNTSAVYGDINNAKIIHYHGKKHCILGSERCAPWKHYYLDLLASFPENILELRKYWGDKRLKRFSININRRHQDVTVVAAVNANNATRFKQNFQDWIRLKGLNKQRFLIFVSESDRTLELSFLSKYRNTRIVRWSHKTKSHGRIGFMFSAFVFGVSKHVKTTHWMRLNSDEAPKYIWWEWPDYYSYLITSRFWGFTFFERKNNVTQSKGYGLDDEPFAGKAFRIRICDPLDFWGKDKPMAVNDKLVPSNTICHIEQTDFTRSMAVFLNRGKSGALPNMSKTTINWYRSLMNNKRDSFFY
jgi:hypothetical protein